MSCQFILSFVIIIVLTSSIFSQAIVPPSRTFKYVNQGEFGDYLVEYSANYRLLHISSFPFILCFYNSTPNAFILGIKMGHPRSESIMRWVWDANRGHPVSENATLTFSSDGNLVLTDVDGTIAWQTNTTNKNVIGLDLLPNGNMVLYDNKGKYVWQSFSYPTDTLLVGQAMRPNGPGPNKLVSRLSNTKPSNGPYSFVLGQSRWAMYYQTKNSPNPMTYYRSTYKFVYGQSRLDFITFFVESEYEKNHAFRLGFKINLINSESSGGAIILARPKYNSTYTMLRVDIDGNLRMYTYDEIVDYRAWEVTYVLFDRYMGRQSECKLPKRCGTLGICDDNQCVACPKPQGLLGWSEECAPPQLPPCKVGAKVDYYKVEGVEHYSSEYYNERTGPVGLGQCKDKCSKDCKCLGFFYRAESSKCLLVPELGTLVKVSNSSHVGYIKFSK